MVSDAMQGHAHGLHEAALATFFRVYGDVRPGGRLWNLLLKKDITCGQSYFGIIAGKTELDGVDLVGCPN